MTKGTGIGSGSSNPDDGRRFLLQKRKTSAARIARKASPPITPPAIGPALDDEVELPPLSPDALPPPPLLPPLLPPPPEELVEGAVSLTRYIEPMRPIKDVV